MVKSQSSGPAVIPESSTAELDINAEVQALEKMTVKQLKLQYEELFNEEARSSNKVWLIKRIAWRMQANVYGDLSERARQRALELADDADIRMKAPKSRQPKITAARKKVAVSALGDQKLFVGQQLTRKYKGTTYLVHVRENGFEWNGVIYSSLSGVAKAITGSHWNGPLFFGLKKKEVSQ